jgi:hypothetical protein
MQQKNMQTFAIRQSQKKSKAAIRFSLPFAREFTPPMLLRLFPLGVMV